MRAATGLIIGAITGQNLLSVENPAGSGVFLELYDLDVAGVPTGIAGTPFLYRYGRTAGLPSGGTTLTAQKNCSNEPAAAAVVRQQPTATAASGSMWVGSPGVLLSGALLGAPLAAYQSTLEPIVTSAENAAHTILLPGEALLVQADANATVWNHTVTVQWREVSTG